MGDDNETIDAMDATSRSENVLGLQWHVVYTRPRHEKKVFDALQALSIETFLPAQKQRRQWSDRKKWIEVPLFPSYVFVRPTVQQNVQVLTTPGVVRYVTFNGRKAIVRHDEIEFLLTVEKTDSCIEVVARLFEAEEKVVITDGLFKGYTGRFLHSHGDGRVAVYIEEIGYSVIIDVTLNEIAPNTLHAAVYQARAVTRGVRYRCAGVHSEMKRQ
jgi:transcriptional antiterminator RfaH